MASILSRKIQPIFPDDVLGQLGNRVQHALRAFTAKDRKELKMAAETYRDNPGFDTAEAIQQVGTGEAVTSFLDAKGIPEVVQRTLIRPPSSQLGPIDQPTRDALMAASDMAGKYDQTLDRESAFEMLTKRADAAAKEAEDAESKRSRFRGNKNANSSKRAVMMVGKQHHAARQSVAVHAPLILALAGLWPQVVIKELKGTTGRRIVRGILGGLFKGR